MDCFHGYTLFLSVLTTREVGRNYLEEGACVIAGSCFFYHAFTWTKDRLISRWND